MPELDSVLPVLMEEDGQASQGAKRLVGHQVGGVVPPTGLAARLMHDGQHESAVCPGEGQEADQTLESTADQQLRHQNQEPQPLL